MEIITSIAKWELQSAINIFGIIVIGGAVYFIALGINKAIPKLLNPEMLAILAGLIAMLTLPSLPRYQFENEALSQIEGKEWIRVINKTKGGSWGEPLTWFNTPVDSIFTVGPYDPLMDGTYREVLLRYDEDPYFALSEPDCVEKTIRFSEPDNERVYRYTSILRQPMSSQELAIYCEYDWSKEKEALKVEALKLLQQNKDAEDGS